MMEISRRLQEIAGLVTPGNRVADIGSDHGYLPVYLIERGISPQCIAGEVNQGPWKSAESHVQQSGMKEVIDVRLGNGLAVLKKGEVDTICIAGMGGSLITAILSAGKDKLEGISELVLQPNVGEPIVRKWLKDEGWRLVDEKIIEEDGIIYEIIRAIPGDGLEPYKEKKRKENELLELGPILWKENPLLLRVKWERELEKQRKILNQLGKSHSPETEFKKQDFQNKIAWIEEVLACLQARRESSNI